MGSDPYAALAKISDQSLRAALKHILDQVIEVRSRTEGIGLVSRPLAGSLDAAGNRLTATGDPQDPEDAVNLRTLQQYLRAAAPAPTRQAPTPILPPGYIPPPPTPPPTGPVPPDPGPGDPTDPGGPPVPAGVPPPSDPVPSEPVPAPAPKPVPPTKPADPQPGWGNIRIVGTLFRKPDGSIYRWKSCTDFLLFKRYLDGENIVPILADRAAVGATMVRVLGMCVNIANFNPRNYPTYLADLPAFADLLAANGFDFEFTVFADVQPEGGILAFRALRDQQIWLQAVRDALLSKPNVVLELVNEGFKNGVDFRNHTRPSGLLCAADAQAPTDGQPANPPWDYSTFHSGRDTEWPRKSKDSIELSDQFRRPAVDDEPMGADEVMDPGKRSNVPNDFFYLAATGMLLGPGATFHSSDGITSSLFRPITITCANSFFAGLNVIPENVMGGRYTRGPLSDCPLQHVDYNPPEATDPTGALRTFASYTDHDAVCVVVRPGPAWVAVAQAGWTIVSQSGPGGCVVFLTK